MKKTISIIILLVSVTLLITACKKEENPHQENQDNVLENELSNTLKEIESENLIHEHCTRAGNAGTGTKVNLSYELYYQDDTLLLLESSEEIETDNKDMLDEYEKAYKKIQNNYKGLDNYLASVTRTPSSVESKIIIEYYKIDIEKLIEIEGADDNIFEDNVPKVSKWKELAERFGTSCTQV